MADFMMYLIDAIIRHGPVVREFRLAPEGGAPLPPWQPGAHVELAFTSRAGARHRNAYSVVGEEGGMLRIAVQREEGGRGGSRVLHDEFEPGMALEVSLPLNGFTLHPGSTRTVLIAGGIGITPMLPMARSRRPAPATNCTTWRAIARGWCWPPIGRPSARTACAPMPPQAKGAPTWAG